jgi:hypothetical protein
MFTDCDNMTYTFVPSDKGKFELGEKMSFLDVNIGITYT